jgi:hypothetical protein
VPIPTRVVTVTEPESALKVLLAAVRVPVTVADPVVVNVDTVVDPALIVPEVLILPDVTPPVAVIPVIPAPSPENFDAVIVPFANISARNRTVVVPWRLVLALIVPIDKNPAVIVPKLPDVAEPTYSAEFKLEVFVPIKTAPSFLTFKVTVPELFVTLNPLVVSVDEPAMVSIADCVVVPMLTVDEPTYNIFVPELTSVPLTTLNALEVPRIISTSAALINL